MLVIIDYKLGNLRSVLYKINKLKVKAKISSDIHDIKKADKLILPGVGHFGAGMSYILKLNLKEVLYKRVMEDKIPILGICLGFQLFSKYSEEGNTKGLGFIDAKTIKFSFENKKNKFRVPHVGWNVINIKRQSVLLKDISNFTRFYFTHSYHLSCHDSNSIVSTTDYGYDFISIIQQENIFGTQFHPEKSHKQGIKIIQNFLNYT